jgi:hypothetical protein
VLGNRRLTLEDSGMLEYGDRQMRHCWFPACLKTLDNNTHECHPSPPVPANIENLNAWGV